MTLTTEQKKTLALLCAGNADVLAKMMARFGETAGR